MDRNRNKNEEHRPLIVPIKRKRGRPMKEPMVIDVEDEAVWISYENEEPDMVFLQPLMRIGQVMVNPAKAGSFSVRKAAAEKIIAKLGAQWAIEGNSIVRRLAFVLDYHYNDMPDVHAALRKFLLNLPEAVTKDILGIGVYPEGKLPGEKAPKWLYLTVPKVSACVGKTGTFLKTRLTPEAVGAGVAKLKRGIFDDSGTFEFATYGERVVNLRMYMSTVDYMARVLYTAIKNGATFAMEYVAHDITIDELLEVEVESLNDTRKADIKKASESLETNKANVYAQVAALQAATQKFEVSERELALVSKKLNKAALIKEYPALASVQGINDDDPTVTIVTTKNIVLNGVDLGEFKIKVNPSMAAVTITNKRTPPNLTHPRLVKLDGKWKWDIAEATHTDLLTALSMNRLAQAINIVVSTLLTIDEKNAEHPKRLDEIKAFMYPKKEEVMA